MIEPPLQMCSYLKPISKNKDLLNQMILDDELADSSERIAELFANIFKTVYSAATDADVQPVLLDIVEFIDFPCTCISKEEITLTLSKLDFNNVSGPDGTPAFLLRACFPTLIEPLYLIFNKSIIEAYFLEIWKNDIVVPVYEDGKRNDLKIIASHNIVRDGQSMVK